MKRILTTTAILLLTAGVASANPGYKHGWNKNHGYGKHHGYASMYRATGRLTPHERVVIARSKARVAKVVRRARADGHVSWFERHRINRVIAKHRALVRKELRD